MLETMRYARKPFFVDAVQVTLQNIGEVAKWCKGEILTDKDNKQYIKVGVKRAANERQTKAYANDWILLAGTGFKVYTPKAFKDSFEQVSTETTMHETSADEIIVVTEQVPETVVARAKKVGPRPGPRNIVPPLQTLEETG